MVQGAFTTTLHHVLKKLSGLPDTMTTVLEKQQLADCCKLLAVFFCEPEMELWANENILEQFSGIPEKAAPELLPIASRMREATETIAPEQMVVDYAALFVGPFELPAPPYGSVYLERSQRVMGDSTMKVMNGVKHG